MKKPQRIERITIRGYRALQDVDLPLGPLNVVIGPNGVGKSSLVDVFNLLAQAIVRPDALARLLSQRGGIGRILTLGRRDSLAVTLKVSAASPKEGPLRYQVNIAASGIGYVIEQELLMRDLGDNKALPLLIRKAKSLKLYRADKKRLGVVQSKPPLPDDELAIGRLTRVLPAAESIRSALAEVHCHAAIPVDLDAVVRRPQTLEPTSMIVAPGGTNLFSVLYQMRQEEPDFYERILDVLRAGFPGFDRLEFPAVAGGQVTLAWYHDAYAGKPFYANELSAGTLRFLHLVTVLLSPRTPTLILIDEPEESLHPELIRLLVELLLEASERTQIIVATQSPALLHWLKPEHIVIADAEAGVCTLTPGASLDLSQWLTEYSLDRLWQIGQLGGRP